MLLGIALLIAAGTSWVLVGAVIGHAARRNIPVPSVQALSAAIMLPVSIGVLLIHPDPECAPHVRLLTMLSIFGSGFLNYFVLNLMGKAMKTGPNGIVWAMVQSALIFPFLAGVIFFGVALTAFRLTGLGAILAALACFGLARDNNSTGSDWRRAALCSFLLAGINQNLSNLPSYFPEAAAVGSVSRSLSGQLGTLAAFLLMQGRGLFTPEYRALLRGGAVWRYAGLLAGVNLVSGYFLMYRGFNLVAEAGAGAVSYPVLVSSCMVGFALYSSVVLKEKLRLLPGLGLACALAGLVCISWS